MPYGDRTIAQLSPIRLIDPMSQLDVSSSHLEPVIEPSNGQAAMPDPTTRAFHLLIRQQEILAEHGVLALQVNHFVE